MLKSLAAAIGLAVLFCAPALAAEQTFEPQDDGQVEFTMPSGNIGCTFTPKGGTGTYEPKDGGPELICERVEPSYVTVVIGPAGEPEQIEDPGEQSCCGATNTLDYGNSVTLDIFECVSEKTGLDCERDDGVGFTMAKAGIEIDAADPDEDDEDDATDAGTDDEDDEDEAPVADDGSPGE